MLQLLQRSRREYRRDKGLYGRLLERKTTGFDNTEGALSMSYTKKGLTILLCLSLSGLRPAISSKSAAMEVFSESTQIQCPEIVPQNRRFSRAEKNAPLNKFWRSIKKYYLIICASKMSPDGATESFEDFNTNNLADALDC